MRFGSGKLSWTPSHRQLNVVRGPTRSFSGALVALKLLVSESGHRKRMSPAFVAPCVAVEGVLLGVVGGDRDGHRATLGVTGPD